MLLTPPPPPPAVRGTRAPGLSDVTWPVRNGPAPCAPPPAMAYPQGFLFQPPVSLALHSACPPPLGAGLLLGPRAEEPPLLGRPSSGSAFAPYSGSAASHRPYGGEQRAAAAAAASLGSFVGPAYDPPSGLSGSLDYHPFGALGPYPYGDPGYRKNATRDATATLKAWLHEHRKNPYPTKGEKIMLAIVTKMTLTQVSTWFANARRRLKKENKMTWTPRTRSEDEEDEDNADLERHDDDEEHEAAAVASCGLMFREDGGGGGGGGEDSGGGSGGEQDFTDSDLKEVVPGPGSTRPPSLPRCVALGQLGDSERLPSPPKEQLESCGAPQRPNPPPKPKLWSLAEIATSGANDSSEGEGAAGPRRAAPRTAFPRHLYYASPFIPGYSSFGPVGPLSGGLGGHPGKLQQAVRDFRLHGPPEPHELQRGTADM